MSVNIRDMPKVMALYQSVLQGEISWYLLSYPSSGQQDELAAFACGAGGLSELKNYLEGIEQVLLGFYREDNLLPDGRPTYVLINYIPTIISGVRKARALVHSRYLGIMFKNHDTTLTFERSSQLTTDNIYQSTLAEPGHNTQPTVSSRPPVPPHSSSRVQERSRSLPRATSPTTSASVPVVPTTSTATQPWTTSTSPPPTSTEMGKAISQPLGPKPNRPTPLLVQPVRRAVSDRHEAVGAHNYRTYDSSDYTEYKAHPPLPAQGAGSSNAFSNFIKRRKNSSEQGERKRPEEAPLPPPKDMYHPQPMEQGDYNAQWNTHKRPKQPSMPTLRKYSDEMAPHASAQVQGPMYSHSPPRALSPEELFYGQPQASYPEVPTKEKTLTPMPSFPLRDKWLAEHALVKDPNERARLRLEAQRRREMEERKALEEEERRQLERKRMKEEQEKQERLEEEMRKIKLEEELKRIATERRKKEQLEREEEERKKRELEEKKRLEKQRRFEEHMKLEEWRAEQARLAEAAANRAEAERRREEELKRSKMLQIEKRMKRNTKSEVLLTGWVTVQTTNSLVWKRRWYRLMGDKMFFYRSPKDMHQIMETVALRGAIRALREWNEGYEELEAIPHSFAVEFVDDRGSWSMFADSEEEKVKLLGLLNHASGL